jgi:hypothetical protein
MKEELIQLPNPNDIREMLALAKQDIQNEIEQDPELASTARLLNELIAIVEQKIGKNTDLSKLALKDQIDVAAHLHFLQFLLEDFFLMDEDFDFDEEDLQFEEEEEEK